MKRYMFICILMTISLTGILYKTNANTKSTTPKKYIALTFDDGPNENTTPLLLDILKAKNVHATFFMIGKNAQQFSGIVQRIYDEWHMIGNHTWDHTNLLWLSNRNIVTEIQKTQKIIKRITWYTPTTLRPPYGVQNGKILRILKIYHLASLQWSLDSNDWELPSSKVLAQNIMDKIQPGKIILMHDTLTGTVQAMSDIIDAIQKSGYTIVTVSELLWGPKHIHPGIIYRRQ